MSKSLEKLESFVQGDPYDSSGHLEYLQNKINMQTKLIAILFDKLNMDEKFPLDELLEDYKYK